MPLPFPCPVQLPPFRLSAPLKRKLLHADQSKKKHAKKRKQFFSGCEDTESGAQAARGPLGNKIRKD